MRIYPVVFAVLNFLWTSFAWGQPAGRSTAVPLLPDIDPQDIEIRGQYRPQFNGLRRQPVLGFNPQPPVFSQEQPRIPFFETPEQVAAGTSISYLERPPQPPVVLRPAPVPTKGYLQTGFGNFITPELRGIYQGGDEVNQFISEVAATGSNGHLKERATSYRMLNAGTEWIYRPYVDTDWRASVRVFNSMVHLYDAQLPAGPVPFIGIPSSVPLIAREREVTGVKASGAYLYNRGMYKRWQLRGTIGYEQAGLTQATAESGITWSVLASGTTPAAKQEQWWDWQVNADGFSAQQQISSWTNGTLRAAYNYRTAFWRLRGGVNVLSGIDARASQVFLFPDIAIRFQSPEWLDFQLTGSGGVNSLTIQQALQHSWYLKTFDIPGNEYYYRGAAELSIRPARLFSIHGALQATRYNQYRFMTIDGTLDADANDATDYRFALAPNVVFLRPSAGVRIWLEDSGLSWYNEVYWQHLDSGNTLVPFVEDFGMVSDLTWQFLQQWYGQVTLRYVSDRNAPQGPSIAFAPLESFLMLDLRLEYKINQRLGLYVSGMNLLNERYELAAAYRERPRQVLGGVTFRF